MKIGNEYIFGEQYHSIVARLSVLIEQTLHRGRTILHTSISADQHRFYACVIWREE